MSMEMLVKTAECLRKRGFGAVCCATAAEAADYVMKEAASAATIGQGGSVTLKQLGLPEKLAAVGKTPERKTAVDLFLLSANALTADGRIVNIDGNGNRVGASINGPKKVVYVVGRNKIVDGGIDDKTVYEAKENGADIFVAGSYVFKAKDRAEAIAKLKNA